MRRLFLLLLIITIFCCCGAHGEAGTSLPRSQPLPTRSAPWNPSKHIQDDGFLKSLYKRIPGTWEEEIRLHTFSLNAPCKLRQVPGDGNCLFHSISLCLCQAVNGTHWDLSCSENSNSRSGYSLRGGTRTTAAGLPPPTLDDLYVHSQMLRRKAVAILRDSKRKLYLQGREYLTSSELVESAAQQYNMDADSYCESMLQESVWGGGPEIVALSNLLKRPIHVYELHHTRDDQQTKCFVLRRLACFGSPKFDRQSALHILSADNRFPDIHPGEQQPQGNHFMAVFPLFKDGWVRAGGIAWNEQTYLGRALSRCERWWSTAFV